MTQIGNDVLTEQAIHIWTIPLIVPKEDLLNKKKLLDQAEQERADQFIFDKDKNRFIASHAALRIIISHYISESPEKIEFLYTNEKKPYLKNNLLQFNLSHSNELALLAVSKNTLLGIDIEYKKNHEHVSLAKRFFSQDEIHSLNKTEEKENAFYQIWTKKEAVLKANGKGLRLPLSSFSVTHNLASDTVNIENETWYVRGLNIDPDYAAAIATKQNNFLFSHFIFSE